MSNIITSQNFLRVAESRRGGDKERAKTKKRASGQEYEREKRIKRGGMDERLSV